MLTGYGYFVAAGILVLVFLWAVQSIRDQIHDRQDRDHALRTLKAPLYPLRHEKPLGRIVKEQRTSIPRKSER